MPSNRSKGKGVPAPARVDDVGRGSEPTSIAPAARSTSPTCMGANVAVITKGDGFVWVKRKHYFAPEYNPRVVARYQQGG